MKGDQISLGSLLSRERFYTIDEAMQMIAALRSGKVVQFPGKLRPSFAAPRAANTPEQDIPAA